MRNKDVENSYTPEMYKNPEKLFAVGEQMSYEWEQDFIAMKWALRRMGDFLKIREKTRDFLPGDNDIQIGYNELLNRISKYSCPNMRKDKSDCPFARNECSQNGCLKERSAKGA